MSNLYPAVSVCRHCQNYRLEGRRGGYCDQLSSLVQGTWKACHLAIPPFAPSWESPPGIREDIVHLFLNQQEELEVLDPPLIERQSAIESLEACVQISANDELPDALEPQKIASVAMDPG